MQKVLGSFLRKGGWVKKSLVHFMSISLMFQLIGLNAFNELASAGGNMISKADVTLLNEHGDKVNSFKADDNAVIKYSFVIPSGTEVPESTEFKFKIPEQFSNISNTDFTAEMNKVTQPEVQMKKEENSQINSVNSDENKTDDKSTINKDTQVTTDSKEQSGESSKAAAEDNKVKEKETDDPEKIVLNKTSTQEQNVKQEENSNKNQEINNNANTKQEINNNANTKNDQVNKDAKEETKENSPALSGTVSVDLVKSISVDDKTNMVTVKSNEVKAQDQNIRCSLTVNAVVNSDSVENGKSKSLEFSINDVMVSKEVSFENNLLSASDFITGVYVSDKKFSDNINDESCPMNKGFDSYIEKNQIKNFDADTSMVYTCYKFKVDDASKIKKGDSFKIVLPDSIAKISSQKDVSYDLKTDKGTSIGKVYYNADNTIQVVFNENASENSNVEGYFWFGRRIDKEVTEKEDKVDIVYTIGDVKYTFTIDLKHVDKSASISKKGQYDRDKNVINWKITVNPGNKEEVFKNYTVYDQLKDPELNSFITDSLVVDGTAVQNGTDFFKDNQLIYTFAEINKNTDHTIEFQTRPAQKVTDSKGQSFTINNTAVLKDNSTDDAKKLCEDTTKVTISNNYIKKTGRYDANSKKVIWTISVNDSKMKLKDVVVEDEIDTNVFEMPKAEDIAADGGQVTISGSKISIKYGNIDTNKKITINTKVKDDVYKGSFDAINKVKNTAIIYSNGNHIAESTSTPVQIGTGGEIITKSALSGQSNKLTDPIQWKITLNKGKLNIKNAKLYENLSDNQEFVSADIYKADDYNDSSKRIKLKSVDSLSSDSAGKTYIDLGDLDDEYVVIVTSKIKDSVLKDLRSSNGWISNKLKDSSTLVGDGLKPEGYEASAVKNLNATVLEKSGSYIKDDRMIEWTIKVNSSNNIITNAVLTDIIPDGQEYVDGSFVIKDAQAKPADSALTNTKAEFKPADANNNSKGGSLTYNFGSEKRSDVYVIKYKTKISDDQPYINSNSNFTAKNKAELTADEFSKPVVKEASVTIKNFLIQKNCAYNDGDDFITWEVKINQNKAKLNGMTIIDTLPAGLKLDRETLKLYKVNYKVDGTIDGNKTIVPESDYTVDYDVSSGILKVIYPGETSDSYLLSFETPVLVNQSKYTNTVSFQSGYTKYVTTKESSIVRYDEYGVGARGERGTVTIVKVDKNDESHKLAGAKFELIRKSDGQILDYTDSESTSDNNGKIVFKRVRYGDYIVKEVKAPDGYELSPDQEITVSSDNNEINLIFKDEPTPIRGDVYIGLTKTFSDNKTGSIIGAGSGAQFTLYTDEACTTPVSDLAVNKEAVWDGARYAVSFSGDYLTKNTVYYLKEVHAPSDYSLSSSIYFCKVDSDGNVTYAEKKQDGTIGSYTTENPVCLDNKSGGSSSGGSSHHHHDSSSDDDSDDNTDVTSPENPNGTSNNPTDNPTNENGQTNVVNPSPVNPNNAITPINNNNLPKDNSISKPKSSSNIVPSKSQSTSHSKGRLPQAGTMIDTKVLISIGFVLIAAGLGICIRRKHSPVK